MNRATYEAMIARQKELHELNHFLGGLTSKQAVEYAENMRLLYPHRRLARPVRKLA